MQKRFVVRVSNESATYDEPIDVANAMRYLLMNFDERDVFEEAPLVYAELFDSIEDEVKLKFDVEVDGTQDAVDLKNEIKDLERVEICVFNLT